MTYEQSLQELGKQLKAIRKELKLSQKEVCQRSGISVQTIVSIEKGNDFTMDSFLRLLRAYKISNRLEALLELPEKPLFQQYIDSK